MKRIIKTELDKQEFIKLVAGIKISDKIFVAEFKRKVKKRGVSLNALYWVWLSAIVEQTDYGYDKDFWHEYYKNKYLPKVEMFKSMISISTTSLNTKDFLTYLERIKIDALTEHGVELIYPDEKRFVEFYEQYEGRVN